MPRYLPAGGLVLTLALILSACRSQETPTTPAVSQATPTLAITATLEAEPTQPIFVPVTPTESRETYPGPGFPSPTQPAYPYPLPTFPGSPTEEVYPPPGGYPPPVGYPPPGGYPGPISTLPPIATAGAYPGPTSILPVLGTPTPLPTVGVGMPTVPATPPATRTPTPSPTATLTPSPTLYSGTPGPTPDSTLLATDPHTVKLASGKVQIIEFFAFWCTNCRMMAPVMNALEAEYGRQMNFVYLDIDDPDVKPLKDALRFTIPKWGVEPNFFLVDERGKILKVWIGLVDPAGFRPGFDAALQQP
jgi:thiol-disulfide isomerase/thioredoxin